MTSNLHLDLLRFILCALLVFQVLAIPSARVRVLTSSLLRSSPWVPPSAPRLRLVKSGKISTPF